MRFHHCNIVARDAERLGAFYIEVLGCERGPDRVLSGPWLNQGLGLADASLTGFHLRLPGQGADGPTLEIFRFDDEAEEIPRLVNRPGLMHLAFAVDDLDATVELLLGAGGSLQGEISETELAGAGAVRFVYARDPEDNVVELQQWMAK